jgi:hypothetical protein
MISIAGARAGGPRSLTRRRVLAMTVTLSVALLAGGGGDGQAEPNASSDGADDTATQTDSAKSTGTADGTATPTEPGDATDTSGDTTTPTEPDDATGAGDATTTATEQQTETGSGSLDVSGSVASEVDQLSIVEHRPRIGYYDELDQTYFPVEITVENGADEQSDVTEYDYNIVTYDTDGYLTHRRRTKPHRSPSHPTETSSPRSSSAPSTADSGTA